MNELENNKRHKVFDNLYNLKQQIQDELESLLKAEFKRLFEEFPNVAFLRWVQYIPSFNDGDACTFTLGDIQIGFFDETLLERIPEYWTDEVSDIEFLTSLGFPEDITEVQTLDLYSLKRVGNDAANNLQIIANALNNFEEEVHCIFGSNSQITATRSEIIVESYDCGY